MVLVDFIKLRHGSQSNVGEVDQAGLDLGNKSILLLAYKSILMPQCQIIYEMKIHKISFL